MENKRRAWARKAKSLFRPSLQTTAAFKIESNPDSVPPSVQPPPPSSPTTDRMKREDTTKTQTQKHLSSQLSTLEILPAELKTKILSSLRSLDDLQAAIQSSPLLWHQYRTEQKIILYNVLSRLLGERVFADAYMVQNTSSLSENMPVHRFMPTHRRNSQPSIIISQCETADLISVAAFYSSVIEPLMETLPQMLLRNLSLPSLPIVCLSHVERTRILRALYRFQLWFNLHS